MAETGASDSSSPVSDRDFDPSADMLVHDYDDERTMEEEENMSGESCDGELDDLQKEGDMPLEQLLAMYGYGGDGVGPSELHTQDTRSSSEEEILSKEDLTLDKEEIARDLLQNSDEDEYKETSVHDLLNSVPSSRLLRSSSQQGSEDEDSETDHDYHPEHADEDWKKTIQVGSSFQAVVPDGLCVYGDAPAYENEDRLLWDPSKLEDGVVEKYLDDIQSQRLQNAVGVDAIPTGAHIRDDEQALYLLLQCGHNVEEALRRRKMQAVPPTDPMSLWSEEECRNFETGLRFYGKDFYVIQQNKVKTRSVGELVQFYYLWKKTERHDIFANKTRLEKRRYTLHPGVTDYMDRFLDEQETPPPVPARDRSASPIHSLLYGDPKRHHLKPAGSENAECPSHFQPIPTDGELNTATPTVLSLSPDHKSRHSSSGSGDQCNTGEHCPITNGIADENFNPAFKKSKLEFESGDFRRSEDCASTMESSPTMKHVDSLNVSSVGDGEAPLLLNSSIGSNYVSDISLNLVTPSQAIPETVGQ